MAENHASAASAGEHPEDLEDTPGYVAPAQKSVNEIAELDQDDEALVKYKQALLGDAASGLSGGHEVEVTVKSMTFVSAGRDPIVLDLSGDLSKLKDSSIAIKEGCEYQLKFSFTVAHQIVSGLKFHQSISRKGIPAGGLKVMLGSFGPRVDAHEFTTPLDEAPKGMVTRGKYHAKCKFIDDDKRIHLAWEWTFKIQQDW